MSKKRKRHSPEQIVAKLRDAEVMFNSGKDLAAVLWRCGKRLAERRSGEEPPCRISRLVVARQRQRLQRINLAIVSQSSLGSFSTLPPCNINLSGTQ
jgi:hypothetical protein